MPNRKKPKLVANKAGKRPRGRPPGSKNKDARVAAERAEPVKPEHKSNDLPLELRATVDSIRDKYGKGSITTSGSEGDDLDIRRVPFGNPIIDNLVGGGIPRGKIVEVSGVESSGKTTFCLSVCAAFQRAGEVAAYIDVEHSVDPEYAKALGVDWDNLLFSQPDSAEEALDITCMLARTGKVGVIVNDSVAAMMTRQEIAGDIGDNHVGVLARVMSQELKKVKSAQKSGTAVIFVNQIRDNVGMTGYGPKQTTPGGRAMKFYASIRLSMARIETLYKTIKNDKVPYGQKSEIKQPKNKCGGIPHRKITVEILYPIDGQTAGFNYWGSLLDNAIAEDVLKVVKGNYSFGNYKFPKGRAAMLRYLEENPKFVKELESKLKDL